MATPPSAERRSDSSREQPGAATRPDRWDHHAEPPAPLTLRHDLQRVQGPCEQKGHCSRGRGSTVKAEAGGGGRGRGACWGSQKHWVRSLGQAGPAGPGCLSPCTCREGQRLTDPGQAKPQPFSFLPFPATPRPQIPPGRPKGPPAPGPANGDQHPEVQAVQSPAAPPGEEWQARRCGGRLTPWYLKSWLCSGPHLTVITAGPARGQHKVITQSVTEI